MNDDPTTDPSLPILYWYTRAQALEDGVLVDVSAAARETGFRYPVALTRAAWALCVALTPAAMCAGNDERGRLHDLLWMLRCAVARSRGDRDIAFELLCVTTRIRPMRVPLRCVIGPGDAGEPVLTVMMPGES
jgi:hypothetical protein